MDQYVTLWNVKMGTQEDEIKKIDLRALVRLRLLICEADE